MNALCKLSLNPCEEQSPCVDVGMASLAKHKSEVVGVDLDHAAGAAAGKPMAASPFAQKRRRTSRGTEVELAKWVAAQAKKVPNGPQSISDLEPQCQVAFHVTGVSPDWVKACYICGGPDGLEFGLGLSKDYLGLVTPTVHL